MSDLLQKIIIGLGVFIAGFLLIGGVLWYLAFGVETGAPSEARIPAIAARATISWSSEGPVSIEAEDSADMLPALGFVHGTTHSWTILLLRQAALGRLGEWFGRESFATDRLMKELRIARDAEAAYRYMPDNEKRRLRSFASGISSALDSRRIRMIPPIVLMEIEPEPWEPWHSLAVERLWAWLSSPVQAMESTASSVRALQEIDRLLRRRLHLFGFENSVGIAAGSGKSRTLGFRYVTGDTGLPVFQPFEFRAGGVEVMRALSVPGTLILPAGRNSKFSWTLLLDSDVSLETEEFEASDLVVSHDRLTDDTGTEEVLDIYRVREKMPVGFEAPDARGERAMLLDWAGLRALTDTPEWIKLIDGEIPSLSLFRNDGIRVDNEGLAVVTGRPATAVTFDRHTTLVTNSVTGAALADRLSELSSEPSRPPESSGILKDTHGSTVRPFLVELVSAGESEDFLNRTESDALSYLRNWDLSFSAESIAASIVDATGRHIDEGRRISSDADTLLAALRSGIAELTDKYGSDMSKWRWETVQDRTVFYPGWIPSQPGDIRPVRQFAREYPPVLIPGRGHHTTLAWGPTRSFSWRMASAAWEGFFSPDPRGAFAFERPKVLYSRFLGRYLSKNRKTEMTGSRAWTEFSRQTILIPDN